MLSNLKIIRCKITGKIWQSGIKFYFHAVAIMHNFFRPASFTTKSCFLSARLHNFSSTNVQSSKDKKNTNMKTI